MSLTDEAIEKIKGMIVSGELRPGDRLPVEKSLADRLGLSRNSLREAVRALTALRVLETRQGAGTFVTSLAPGLVLDAVSFIVNFHDPQTAVHFVGVRRILDAEAAARASVRITDDELAELREIHERLCVVARHQPIDTDKLIELDRKFHSRIASACGNPALAALADMLGGQTVSARALRLSALETTASNALVEHEQILEALQDRDPERARLRAGIHVLQLEEWLTQQGHGEASG
ncbi:FadR/GntR family transcriptional regulator [Actinotalea caeni]|uniref:FadR/GntR family transcriptional regulator n=1 Tax=Actinotalea caeni TaxID=1348467 RepID=UPI0012E24439|nr:FadR/GntR family transcriptional regulator [Actinotalea caeni]